MPDGYTLELEGVNQRGRVEQQMDMLYEIKRGNKAPTSIAGAAVVNGEKGLGFFDNFVDQKLVDYTLTRTGRKRYSITPRGVQLLKLWRDVLGMLNGESTLKRYMTRRTELRC